MEKKKYIKFSVAVEEHEELSKTAKGEKITLAHLCKSRVLSGKTATLENANEKFRNLMPAYYNIIKCVENEQVRGSLERLGGEIWQSIQ